MGFIQKGGFRHSVARRLVTAGKPLHARIAVGLLFAFSVVMLCGWLTFSLQRTVDPIEVRSGLRITADNLVIPASAPDAAFKIYGVDVVHPALPFRTPVLGHGIYIGNGAVLTAAHIVGRIPSVTRPRVIIAGQDLPAKVVKQGAFDRTDLALLSVDEDLLPVSLRLRRAPLCKEAVGVGHEVVVVYPERTVRQRMISPLVIQRRYRDRLRSLIDEPQGSGAGVFDPAKRCLLGIISGKITKWSRHNFGKRIVATNAGFAGFFVPLPDTREFLPDKFRF